MPEQGENQGDKKIFLRGVDKKEIMGYNYRPCKIAQTFFDNCIGNTNLGTKHLGCDPSPGTSGDEKRSCASEIWVKLQRAYGGCLGSGRR